MTNKDSAKGVEAAEVTEVEGPEGMRMEPHPDHPDHPPVAPKGKSGRWIPVQVAEGDAHHDHEQVWVEHHGLNNGHYAKGQLFRFEEGAK